jgi:hypothetical protein
MDQTFVLVTENLVGNVHAVAQRINSRGLASYVLSLDFSGGTYTVVIFRVPKSMAVHDAHGYRLGRKFL